jgi:L-ascorbate metabolism protein UlaG (beta-lactamase superfamily)
MAGFVRLPLMTAIAAGIALFAIEPATAQAPPAGKPEMRENCPGLIASGTPRIIPVNLQHSASIRPITPVNSPSKTRVNTLMALNPDQVRITYSGHSTFLIESPQLVRVATDYNDYVRPTVLPDVVTMNHAHSTHYTDRPDPRIPHVLRGWGPSPEQPARHDVQVRDVRVRNVPTNIRDWSGSTERHGNSIFIYEMANMCIAHLGHLHHTLTQQQLDEIGRIDVVFAPVDGTLTLDTDGMIEVLQGMKAQLVIPMHYFSSYTLQRFLDRAKHHKWDVELGPVPSTVVSKTTLPATPKVLVLPGR